jgi:hypothetical protein
MSALTLIVSGSAHGAQSPGRASQDDRAANKGAGDAFAAVLDQSGSEPSADSTAPADKKAADDASNFQGDAPPSRGAGDWVEALLGLSGAAEPADPQAVVVKKPAKFSVDGASSPHPTRLDWAGPSGDDAATRAVDAKILAGDKRKDDAHAPENARSNAKHVGGLSSPANEGLAEAPASSRAKDATPKRAAPAGGDPSPPQEGACLAATNPDSSSLAVVAPSQSIQAGALPGAGGAEPGLSESGDLASVRTGFVSSGRATGAPDGLSVGGAKAQGESAAPAASTRVSVSSQATWLAPVQPDLALGAGGATLTTSGGAPTLENIAREHEPPSGKTLRPAEASAAAEPAQAAATATRSDGSAASAAVLSVGQDATPSASIGGTRAAASPAAASPAAASAAPAPRRDLEVTLSPQDLGGLALRLKSVGDRLELAFVADKGDTARMIDDRRATLESQLRDAGLGLGGVAISVAARAEGGAGQNADGAGQGGTGQSGSGQGASGAPRNEQGSGQGQEREATSQRQDYFGRDRQDGSDDSNDNANEARGRRSDRGLYL